MDKIESAKQILKKGIQLQDEELIALANSILGEVETPEPTPTPTKRGRPKKTKVAQANEGEFIMRPKDEIHTKRPVQWSGNLWKDTGELGELGAAAKKTPSVKKTPRNRPKVEKIKIVCTSCNKTVETLPIHKTDFFKCDRCLSKMFGGR